MHALVVAALVLSATAAPTAVQAPATRPAEETMPIDPSADIFPFPVTERTLANGLKVLVVPTGFPSLVTVQIVVQTGSRNEVEPGKSGFAHFFEHLMFRGTPTNPPERYQAIMNQAGARENASTSDDWTRYHAVFAKDDLEPILALYADTFQNLAFSEAAFKTEAGAILGEYNKNSADPEEKLEEARRDAAFSRHTYKHTTMGFLKDIEDMPNQYAYSKAFFERWYRPELCALLVAGDVEPEAVIGLAEKHFGGWKRAAAPAVTIAEEPAPDGPKYVHVPWTSPTLPWVTVGFRSPSFVRQPKDVAALQMLASLEFGPTSDLYQRLVVREQKVDALSVDNPRAVDPLLFVVSARLKNPADATWVRDQILAAAAQATVRPPQAARLEEAKSNARYGFARAFDSTERAAGALASFLHYDRSPRPLNDSFRHLAALTPDDLLRVARTTFTDRGLIVTTLSREALPEGTARLPELMSLARKEEAAAATPAPPLPPIPTAPAEGRPAGLGQKLELPSKLPLLSLRLLFETGSADDPAGKEGLATLAAAMLAEGGSRTLSIEQVERALYPMAGAFSAEVDKEMTVFSGSIHRDNWRPYLSIVLAQLLDPGWREDDFRRLKDRQKNALIQNLRGNNDEELGKERLQERIFAGTPYGHTSLGTVAGLDAITLDDVKGFVRSHLTRARLSLGLAGAVPAEMAAALEGALANLPPGEPRKPRAMAARKPAGIEVEIVEKDTRSTAISLGHPIAVTRSHPDFAALNLARAWLGEHRSSGGRLFQRIRGARGLNYGDYAYIEAFPGGMYQFFPAANRGRRSQIFEIWLRPVRPENAPMALKLALDELESMLKTGLSQADLDETRDYLRKNAYVMTARQGQQLGYALDSRWYGIAPFPDFVRESLARLTVEQVNAAIRKHLSVQDLQVVAVTRDAKGLQAALLSETPSTVHYDGDKPQAILDDDRRVGARKLGLKPEKVRITPVDEVFAR